MKIALDWDGTFTADKDLWKAFVTEAMYRGHEVAIVTARSEDRLGSNKELEDTAAHLFVPVVYTNGVQKQDVYGADIWIDDRPDTVVGAHQVQHLIDVGHVKLNEK